MYKRQATASIGIVRSSTWLMHGMLAGLYTVSYTHLFAAFRFCCRLSHEGISLRSFYHMGIAVPVCLRRASNASSRYFISDTACICLLYTSGMMRLFHWTAAALLLLCGWLTGSAFQARTEQHILQLQRTVELLQRIRQEIAYRRLDLEQLQRLSLIHI